MTTHLNIDAFTATKYVLVSLVVKVTIKTIVGQDILRFAHFNTPLSSIDGVKEAINSYESSGVYYSDPNGIY